MGVYNWLDKKLGGVLPGGKPYGSDSKPVDVNTTTATSSGDPTAIKNETPSKTKSTFQMLSYPDGLDNTAEYPHQVIINVLVRETQVEGGTGANLPSGGRGEVWGQIWAMTLQGRSWNNLPKLLSLVEPQPMLLVTYRLSLD